MIHDTISTPIARRNFAAAFISKVLREDRIHTLWNDETGETYYAFVEGHGEIRLLNSSYELIFQSYEVEVAIRRIISIVTPK